MPRRTLRKIDPALNLAEHLRELAELPGRIGRETLFSRPAPLEIEVGSGKGLFLLSASGERPHHNFMGIEMAQKYAEHSAARLARAARANALMIHGDGVALFHERLAPASAVAVHVYFPDPWWKKRHRKRRVMNETLLPAIERVLEPGGTLHFWTDVEEYFQSSLELVAATTTLQGPFAVPERPATGDLDFRTHFERRMRLNELPVYRAEFRKPELAPGPERAVLNGR